MKSCQRMLLGLLVAANLPALDVTSLGTISDVSNYAEQNGTSAKLNAVIAQLGLDASLLSIWQCGTALGGNTSIRNQYPPFWKDKGYYRRSRDLGQVFTVVDQPLTIDRIILRTGNDSLAYDPDVAGAEVFLQIMEVTGEPVINDFGTPKGTDSKHGFTTNHRADDFIEGVTYTELVRFSGGIMPDLLSTSDGHFTYLAFDLQGSEEVTLKPGRYAYMLGFVDSAADRNFTLANKNAAWSSKEPSLTDSVNPYTGGWSLRREGDGTMPPDAYPGDNPPSDPEIDDLLQAQALFPAGEARYTVQPGTDGYPDVDTYRDHEFYIVATEPVEIGLQAQALSHEEIRIRWNTVPESIEWLLLQRKQNDVVNKLMLQFVDPATDQFRDRSLQPETQYNYALSAGKTILGSQ